MIDLFNRRKKKQQKEADEIENKKKYLAGRIAEYGKEGLQLIGEIDSHGKLINTSIYDIYDRRINTFDRWMGYFCHYILGF